MHPFHRHLPNVLSLSRIPIAAAFLITFSTREAAMFWSSMAVLAIALLTDVLDGRLARMWNTASTTGYFLDGLGDKVFYAAILLVIARENPAQTFLAWALIARELI